MIVFHVVSHLSFKDNGFIFPKRFLDKTKCYYIFLIFSILVDQRPKNTFKNYGERIQK